MLICVYVRGQVSLTCRAVSEHFGSPPKNRDKIWHIYLSDMVFDSVRCCASMSRHCLDHVKDLDVERDKI